MADGDKVFAGSIPENYDTWLVPLIFEEYASDLAERIAALDPDAVLEAAAGSGVVTRALALVLGPETRYVVSDLNQPMLDRAASQQASDDRIRWQQADAPELPYEDDTCNVVCCQFGVMFFPDRVAGYREARRVLKPGGKFIFNAWDAISENVFADIVAETAGAIFPDDPPLFLARTPHGYNDITAIRADVEAAGYSDIQIETIAKTSKADSVSAPAIAYCQGTPLRTEIEDRNANLLQHITGQASAAIEERYGAGPVVAKIQVHVVTALA